MWKSAQEQVVRGGGGVGASFKLRLLVLAGNGG